MLQSEPSSKSSLNRTLNLNRLLNRPLNHPTFIWKGWLMVVFQEPKHVQPKLFRQARQRGRLFCSESAQHGHPDCALPCCANNPVAVTRERCWWEPPQPQLNACSCIGVRRFLKCSQNSFKVAVRFNRSFQPRRSPRLESFEYVRSKL